ncbi:MAG TPA: amidase [Thermomicrobiales bacterium]|nr:amidase [Thermomicrobiales bacterium]
MTTKLHDLSLAQAQRQLQDGTLTAVDLMTAVLDQIPKIPVEHSPWVMVRNRDTLLQEAATADAARANGLQLGALHGIPVGIKDIVDVAGIPTKCGSASMNDAAPAEANAPVVSSLIRAGGIIIGKTVTQEFAAGTISAPSRNPWDLDRIPGGSSGGSAAAVAAGMSLLAIGTDTGGSIRCPASVCGVTGLKPTYGAVSRRGVYPLAWSLDTVGPLARTVHDCAIAFDAIAGYDHSDPGSYPTAHASARTEIGQPIEGLRIAVPRLFFWDALEPGLDEIFEATIQQLRDLGAVIVEQDWDLAREARFVALAINRVETSAVHEQRVRTHQGEIGAEWKMRVKAGLLAPAQLYVRGHQARIVIRHSIARYFSDNNLDAMITPATTGVAARADDLFLTYANGEREHVLGGYTRMAMPINATGQPAISVPVGFTQAGLPIGMQIVGRPFAEARICRIGHAYEAATRWIDRRPSLSYGGRHV